jgi:hypothetical protein
MEEKFWKTLVDCLVLKTMTNESPKAQVLGGEAACPTRCGERIPPWRFCDKLPA